jgi:hypothetical protein
MGRKHIDHDLFERLAPSHTHRELAEIFGISVKWVRILRTRTKGRVDAHRLVDLARTGLYTTRELAEMCGTTANWASVLCRRHGVVPRSARDILEIEPEKLPEATNAPPGTMEKMFVLQRRAERCEQLWHPDDAVDWSRLETRLAMY